MHGNPARYAAHQFPARSGRFSRSGRSGRFGRFGAEADAAAAPDRPLARVGEGAEHGKKRGMRLELGAQAAKQFPPILTQVEVRQQLVSELRLHETWKPWKPR